MADVTLEFGSNNNNITQGLLPPQAFLELLLTT